MLEQFIKIAEDLSLSEEVKELLYKEIKAIKKNIDIAEFKYHRTLIDKAAISNVLTASIKEIEEQKKMVEEAKNEIAKNMFELDKQKQLIEIKNRVLNDTMDNLKDAQSQLIQSEKMASLGQLTAGVAHEINNPINFVSANIKPLKDDLADLIKCIRLYKQTVKEKGLENEFEEVEKFNAQTDIEYVLTEVNDLLKGIEEGASRTSEIVKGLRNFSRIDQHDVKKANLNEGVESTLTLLHSTYRDRIEIIKEYGNIPEIECFPGQLNQVFMNLLSNAVQAIKGEGKIFIKTFTRENNVIISIKDTGPGMTEEIKSKIFDPFFTTKEVGKGTGLGLSISYGIIEKHNGKMEVFSSPGEGAEFIITLPLLQKTTTPNT
ncbi:MAG: HAMP domain-containing histidine kinase [Chitinophagaceae bacterium]|nr:HAMP domain-containing histidine kinase [Chitinophagaceae bacterium]